MTTQQCKSADGVLKWIVYPQRTSRKKQRDSNGSSNKIDLQNANEKKNRIHIYKFKTKKKRRNNVLLKWQVDCCWIQSNRIEWIPFEQRNANEKKMYRKQTSTLANKTRLITNENKQRRKKSGSHSFSPMHTLTRFECAAQEKKSIQFRKMHNEGKYACNRQHTAYIHTAFIQTHEIRSSNTE